MQLLMNLSMVGQRPTGLGHYAQRCAQAASQSLDCELVAPAGWDGLAPVLHESPANITLGAGRLAALRRWAFARGLPQRANRLVYSPTHHGLPGAAGDTNGQVLTVHDLIALRHPRQHPVQSLYFRTVLPRALARCSAVFTVSETSRIDLHEHYGLPLSRLHVVPNGVDTAVFKPADPALPREPFLLMVGAAYAHKNVDEVLDRAALWRHRHTLTVVSCRGAYKQSLQRRVAALGLQDRVVFRDYVSQAALVGLYQRCSALLYPSRWEGFGIPPLEAMACGAPVIASDIAVHREVLGSHARLVRLGDEDAWAAALASLPGPGSTGPVLPAGSSDDASSPVRRYTWARSAALLVQHLCAVEPRLQQRSAPA